jgi:hypothetical protein
MEAEKTKVLKLDQYNQLLSNLAEFEKVNAQLIQKLHDKEVTERKVFGILKEVQNKLIDAETGEVDTVKALELFTDDVAKEKLFKELSGLKPLIEYYEKNVVISA